MRRHHHPSQTSHPLFQRLKPHLPWLTPLFLFLTLFLLFSSLSPSPSPSSPPPSTSLAPINTINPTAPPSSFYPTTASLTQSSSSSQSLSSIKFFNETVPQYLRRITPMMSFTQNSNPSPNTDKIFVSIPSYRDPLCSTTLKLLFQHAKHPERVFVGLCDQLDSGEQPCQAPAQYRNQVRTVQMPFKLSRGPTLARYIISKLWDGEHFMLMIDAHTHFISAWDTVLIDMANRLGPKSIVTHYPVGEDRLLGHNKFNHLPVLCKARFKPGAPKNMMLQECEDCRAWNKQPSSVSCPSVFLGAGFLFGGAGMLRDAPFDRYLPWLFQGEEMLMAARLWTTGWEFYAPTTNVVSHVYGYRNHSFSVEISHERKGSEEDTNERVRYLMGVNSKRPRTDAELEELGMGRERTLAEYLEFAGLDLVNQKQTSRCKQRYDFETKKWVEASAYK